MELVTRDARYGNGNLNYRYTEYYSEAIEEWLFHGYYEAYKFHGGLGEKVFHKHNKEVGFGFLTDDPTW